MSLGLTQPLTEMSEGKDKDKDKGKATQLKAR
jgi:hypothetical protein